MIFMIIFPTIMRIDLFCLGIIILVLGIFYLRYSINSIKKNMDKSDSFDKSDLVSDFVLSIGCIMSGVIILFKNV